MEYNLNEKLKILFALLTVAVIIVPVLKAAEEDTEKIEALSTGLGANDLGELAWDNGTLWIEGSGALVKVVGDGYSLADWITYKDMDGFGKGSISAIHVSGDTLIVAWRYSSTINDTNYPVGDGFSFSTDGGNIWRHVKIEDIFPERAVLDPPGIYTNTYDIVLDNGSVWCSTTTGFLLKTDDLGFTWSTFLPTNIPDSLENKFGEENYHGQCVDVYGDTVWVGTFDGMNASFDGGESWTNFSWPEDGSTETEYPGDFAVAVEHQVVDGKTYVWVASREYIYTGLGKYGICVTSDNGQTWEYKIELDPSESAWNFAFGHNTASDDSVSEKTVYAATGAGLMVSYDHGDTWSDIEIRASDDLYWDDDASISSVVVAGDELWVTSSDGAARSKDWGETWEIFKGITRVESIDTGNRNIGISSEYDTLEGHLKTYAFPNPFSPKRAHKDYSRTRIQYALENDANVTIRIYSYSGKLVQELLIDENRSGGRDYQEVWNGTDGSGEIVPNGVYFYIINTNEGDSARGKIMVLD